jgi:UDP-N-acetylmuramoyl-L-alanyl-D-glutamate--2,6-diaminopimelate ligase
MPQVPGRLESVIDRAPFRVYVDYAHTPDALENVLKTLRNLGPKKLITVFGCGGDRDRTKRAPMGQAADRLSDFCILTSDNPRTEDPQTILDDTSRGMRKNHFRAIIDRREAIDTAIRSAGEGDIILIAGKGHEPYQDFGDRVEKFDDSLVARDCTFAAMSAKREAEKEAENNERTPRY